jgi:hypothetical protein
MDFELDHGVPNGGSAGGRGGCFHVSFRSGSRGGGASARSGFDYISRRDEYAGPERDAALYTESDHMPSWAEDDPGRYWDAADLFERANGRLYVSADFALPRDLDPQEQIALAHQFAKELAEEERLPYTLAIHGGRDEKGREHNPHAQLMFSERRNDGIERSREQWFRRADSAHPERGGAPKSRTFHGRDWVEGAREGWASMTNAALERAGRSERVDHRSYERQGVDKEPGQHFGPSAPHMVVRGEDHERLVGAASTRDHQDSIRAIDAEIARLESARSALLHGELLEAEPEQEQEPERHHDSPSPSGQPVDDDRSWGR